MAIDNLTLVVNGDVPFDAFTKALENFHGLIKALSAEVGSGDVEWSIGDLQRSSAIVTIVGTADDISKVERTVRAYSNVGRSLGQGEALPYSRRVLDFANGIASVVNHNVPSVIFQTPDDDHEVFHPLGTGIELLTAPPARPVPTHGAIEGRIQTLTSRRGLRFTLYDSSHDKAVSCYLKEGDEDLIRGMWDSRAIVEGLVSRDSTTFRPIAIREVSRISPVREVERGSYRRARGILPFTPEMQLPEQIMRRVRNAE